MRKSNRRSSIWTMSRRLSAGEPGLDSVLLSRVYAAAVREVQDATHLEENSQFCELLAHSVKWLPLVSSRRRA